MNVTECISFLGYSSIYPDLDLFMINNGIKKRPQDTGGTEHLKTPDGNAILGFQNAEVFKVEKLLPVKSDGEFIFSEIDVYPENEGLLPYGLTFNDNLPSLVKKLGDIIEDFTRLLPEKRVVSFFYDFLVIVIFLDFYGKISLIRFYLPDIYHKNNLGVNI